MGITYWEKFRLLEYTEKLTVNGFACELPEPDTVHK